MRLSVSAIGCYLSCGLKYKFVYIDKLPAQIEIPAMKKGSDIHSLFENYSKSFPPVEVTEELIEEHKKVIPVTEYQKYKEHIDNFIDLNKYILFSNEKSLIRHFEDHGNKLGYDTPLSYQQGASNFLTGAPKPGTAQMIRTSDNSLVRYNFNTQEFGVISSDGTRIKTYFKPYDDPINSYNYYLR